MDKINILITFPYITIGLRDTFCFMYFKLAKLHVHSRLLFYLNSNSLINKSPSTGMFKNGCLSHSQWAVYQDIHSETNRNSWVKYNQWPSKGLHVQGLGWVMTSPCGSDTEALSSHSRATLPCSSSSFFNIKNSWQPGINVTARDVLNLPCSLFLKMLLLFPLFRKTRTVSHLSLLHIQSIRQSA